MRKIIFIYFIFLTVSLNSQTFCDSLSVNYVASYQGLNEFNFIPSHSYIGNETFYPDSLTYLWDLDDTTTSTLESPSHSYGPGNYEVCVQVTYQAMGVTCLETFCDSVKVGSVCDSLTPVSYSYTNTSGTTYSFNSTPISYTGTGTIHPDSIIYYWDFDDGNSSSIASPTNTFASGDYEVCLQNIYNAPGEVCVSSYCDTISLPSICDSILASFISSLVGASQHSFNPSYSLSGGGTVDTNSMSYLWHFGDGDTSSLKRPLHTYSPGDYTVCLDFTYQEIGTVCTQTICDTITIVEVCDSLTPTFSFNNLSLNDYSFIPTYSYTGSAVIDTNLMSFYWDFGDGDTSFQKYPVHNYESGTYTACMQFTYAAPGDTCIQTVCDTFTVYSICDSITTSFTSASTALNTRLFSPSHAYAGTGSLDTNLITYTWNFGDGSIPTNQKSPTHTFPNGGDYTVCLDFSYQLPGGTCTKSYCDTLTISSLCDSISIYHEPTYVSSNTFIFNPFINYTGPGTLDSTNSNYSWSFGDGSTSNQKTPTHLFTPGTHTICLQFNYQLSGVTCIKTFCDTLSTTVTASINELTTNSIKVFPNPATENITISLTNRSVLDDNVTIKLMDLSGKVVYNASLITENTVLNISAFDRGYYLLVIENRKEQIVQKLIFN